MNIIVNFENAFRFLAWAGDFFKLNGVGFLTISLGWLALVMFASLAGLLVKALTGNLGSITSGLSGDGMTSDHYYDGSDPINEYIMLNDDFANLRDDFS